MQLTTIAPASCAPTRPVDEGALDPLATFDPVPPRRLARVHADFAALHAIADAAVAAQRTYRTLSHQINGNDRNARFHSLKAQFQPAT